MGLVIHDLTQEQWENVSGGYTGWTVVSDTGVFRPGENLSDLSSETGITADTGTIRPCIGCFCCWDKTPGQCIVPDGYDNIGALIHHAEEVVVISRYTWGGFSGFVKNVFDRCLGYVLPQFEMTGGESHHQKRYDEDKAFTFIFYGRTLTDTEKESAERYVRAVCTNIRGHVKEVVFREDIAIDGRPEEIVSDGIPHKTASGRTVLLNGSMRNVNGNSAKFARCLAGRLDRKPEFIDLKDHLADLSGLVRGLEDAGTIVLCLPLYVDGLPSQVIRLFERLRDEYSGGPKNIYLLANMGLYESSQLVNLFESVRQWCGDMGFEYRGGLGISAGELLGVLMDHLPLNVGPTRNVGRGMRLLADAINKDARLDDFFAEPHLFPRSLYISIANNNWNSLARKNGIRPEDLYRKL